MSEEQTQETTTPTTPAGAVSPDIVAELHALKAELLQYRSSDQARKAEEAKRAKDEAIKKGQLDEIARNHEAALRARDEALEKLVERPKRSELRRSLTEALASHKLVDGAVEDLVALWGGDFQVDDAPNGDGYVVRSKSDLRSPRDVIGERLASKRFAHFVLAEQRGGTGGAGGTAGQGSGAAVSATEKTFAQQMKERLAAKYKA